jgi:hypothetical protein
MSYDISYYTGYLINIEDLIKGFPELGDDIDDIEAYENSLKSLMIEKIYEGLNINGIELLGQWSGDQVSGGTYWLGLNKGEVYVQFSKEQLINVVRTDGHTTETKSTSLIKLEDFLIKNEIPLEALHYEEWFFGS